MARCCGLWSVLGRCRALSRDALLTYLLFCAFGIGSWVAINGIWAEISVLVLTLPECYKLASILVVVIQVANVGPLSYALLRYVFQRLSFKQIHLERVTVYVLVVVGTISCVFLSLFWSHTATILGSVHSVALIVLTLSVAVVDCTSSVVFLPFMTHFPSEYISALYVGEGLSGVLPSVFALTQGFVNDSLHCVASYPGRFVLGINFSPNVFFIFLAAMMLICGAAFTLINALPSVRKQQVAPVSASPPVNHSDSEESTHEEEGEDEGWDDRNVLTPPSESPSPTTPLSVRRSFVMKEHPGASTWRLLSILKRNCTIFVCLGLLNFATNGVLPSLSPYTFTPYGNSVYHLAINLGLLANPLAALFYAVVSQKSPPITAMLTAVSCLLGLYLFTTALLNPAPLLCGNVAGKIIVVVTHVAMSAIVSYAKVSIAVQLHSSEQQSGTALFLAGLVTQLGSLLGAVLSFCIVNYGGIFN